MAIMTMAEIMDDIHNPIPNNQVPIKHLLTCDNEFIPAITEPTVTILGSLWYYRKSVNEYCVYVFYIDNGAKTFSIAYFQED